jgi:hypothetical protein
MEVKVVIRSFHSWPTPRVGVYAYRVDYCEKFDGEILCRFIALNMVLLLHVYLFCAQCTHSTRCRTVTSFSSRSPNHERPSFDTHKAMIMDMVVEAPQNRQEAKVNVSDADHVNSAYLCSLFKALVRDGFRCVVSGLYDTTSVEHNKEPELELKRAPVPVVCATECAHIFPESTNANISGSNAQGNKVCIFPAYLVFITGHGITMILACGQFWSVLIIRLLLRS